MFKLPMELVPNLEYVSHCGAGYNTRKLERDPLRAAASESIDPRLNAKVLPTGGRVQVDAVALGRLHQERDELRAERDGLRKDAARYRYWIENATAATIGGTMYFTKDALVAGIDAALSRQGKETT